MPSHTIANVLKRARKAASGPSKRHKHAARGTESQPVDVDAPQLAKIASQPDNFESQLCKTQPEKTIVAPTKDGSEAAAATINEAGDTGHSSFDEDLMDTFDGIDWACLPLYIKPLASQTQRKSWVYRHGYCVMLHANKKRFYFVCRHCHEHKYIDAGRGGVYETTNSTSTAARHLE
ncbi:hypothetical protein EJ02DRAFT_427085 [Clathrospora elynae]|uniref:Uncharacterized protein n=1 Tax=Clathrospora elynae TaxID=706981 RepID=A0A6A5SAX2_9PLEO|nr:hypothetical protein EJ02DRAFT_427085 [Clathrospora elynae]